MSFKEGEQSQQQQREIKQEKQDLFAALYPFQQPPNAILETTYAFTTPEAYLSLGYHQAPISALLRPREDGKVLVPGIALDASYPSLNMQFVVTGDLPRTQQTETPWSTWVGRNVIGTTMMGSKDFEPAQAKTIVSASQEVRDLYWQALEGERPDQEKLDRFFGQYYFPGSTVHSYYTVEFPKKLLQTGATSDTVAEVEQTLARVPARMQQAQDAYEELVKTDPAAALLLQNTFRVVVQVEPAAFAAKGLPVVYSETDIPQILANPAAYQKKLRDPREILGFPTGIAAEEITCLYFPDELNAPEFQAVRHAFMQKVDEQGIALNTLRTFSAYQAVVYENCDARYGKFTPAQLARMIEEGTLVQVTKEASHTKR